MIAANYKYITQFDIDEVRKLNPLEDDFEASFVTDGCAIYYVDGFTEPQEIRILDEDERFMNLPEMAGASGLSEDEMISFMRQYNIGVDIDNIGENGFGSEADVRLWWADVPPHRVFKIFDEYYGVAEYIASL
jgi:hypothetical protein